MNGWSEKGACERANEPFKSAPKREEVLRQAGRQADCVRGTSDDDDQWQTR